MLQATETRLALEDERALEDPDRALVQAAKQGDLGAFEELLRRHQATVFRIARHMLGSPEDAEEIAQEAFLKAYDHLDRFEECSRFSTWLTRIAVNAALMKLRQRRSRPTVPLPEEHVDDRGALPQTIADWRPNPEQIYGTRQLRDILARALDTLPQTYRAVFLLRDVEEFSVKETADILGLTLSAVKTRLRRARLQLRERLSVYFAHPQERREPEGQRRNAPASRVDE